MNAEDFELAMDSLFASLPLSHLAVRAGTIADPRRRDSETQSQFRPTCPRCGESCPPGSSRCACGCRLVVNR